ncbi:glycine betaine transport protein [Corynebacterium halotolerans YIM 70093 = DSM 44683]|uniref:Glycine betaine transport protein n=1 Tax=Corynebacterium halotolerans YIM 70093 = DSM 44683 TaxID=1121362 RepID=M1NP58_9CORY|nr:glycine betaine transport protein [Corynebacterium halotolerans YIM 70093 = DSM 44683]
MSDQSDSSTDHPPNPSNETLAGGLSRRLFGPTRGASVGIYPHDIHPGLVPGISVDEQRNRFGLDRGLFFVTAALIVAFIIWGVTNPESVSEVSSTAFDWGMKNTGWLLNLVMILGLGVMIYLAFSRKGRITLGRDDEEPEFSRFSWIAMMFGAGIGVGIFFFGPSEPLSYFLSPPPHTVEAGTPEALHQAVAQSHFHWGLSAWGLYALVGGALAYSTYRRGRVSLLSSVFRPLFGAKQTDGLAGRIIDMLAIIATLFGTAATLGLSAVQISQGMEIISGAGPLANNTILVIIAVLGVAFIISAVSGVARGIRYLSNINITLTLALVAFVFVFGPSLFLLNLIPSGVATYLDEMLPMMGKSLSWGEETLEFQGWWTAFYWAWWIAWTPFVGMFIARISRGRTLREFALVTMAVPTFILILAFTIFGGAAISFHREGVDAFDGTASNEQVLFALFDQLPLSAVTPFILILVLAIFFVTSADSASVVMGTMSSKGDPAPSKLVVVFWGLCMMGIAVVMLLAGGETALSGLQNLTILIALPFSAVLILMIVAFLRDLATDPVAIRRTYARTAVENAVVRGLEEHGDDFELSVSPAPEGRGAGADFDSTSDRVTRWYQRTDEEGNEVDYDYSTGEWADGWTSQDDDDKDPDTATLPGSEGGGDTGDADEDGDGTTRTSSRG